MSQVSRKWEVDRPEQSEGTREMTRNTRKVTTSDFRGLFFVYFRAFRGRLLPSDFRSPVWVKAGFLHAPHIVEIVLQ
jgi:hypothetical protein